MVYGMEWVNNPGLRYGGQGGPRWSQVVKGGGGCQRCLSYYHYDHYYHYDYSGAIRVIKG